MKVTEGPLQFSDIGSSKHGIHLFETWNADKAWSAYLARNSPMKIY